MVPIPDNKKLVPEEPPQTVVLNKKSSPYLGCKQHSRKPKGMYKLMNEGLVATLAQSSDENAILLIYTLAVLDWPAP